MGVLNYTIQFYSDWHCGSGLAAGADVDALVIKDKDGLPYVPGKTIKGLVREVIEDFYMKSEDIDRLFGTSGDIPGSLFFSNAVISKEEREVIVWNKWQKNLYRSLASTAIDSEGIAVEHSLRRIEVAIPMTLTGRITGCDENEKNILIQALGLIKRLGSNRSRGLGRCDIVMKEENGAESPEGNGTESPNVLKFKCELLSDVVLNQKSASEGANSTLDFIPGNCFLGIAASRLYNDKSSESFLIFHSGKVRFGDAHPLVEVGIEKNRKSIRALRTPACMYYPKLEDEYGENLYISYKIANPDSNDMRKLQLKQCRSGFYAFVGDKGYKAANDKSFALKSARDKDKLRSKDSQMYGYESLSAGQKFCFEVEIDECNECNYRETIAKKIKEALTGVKHIGRSRSSQYGEVRIEECNYEEIESCRKVSGEVVVYADGRLIFINKNSGLPTFRPTADDLGLTGGKIDWEKSQIRTFQYAPWNGVRKCFDTDRCGIEKGSVFVVTKVKGAIPSGSYVGSYRNEGFGRVIYNPDFLEADKAKAGKAICHLNKYQAGDSQEKGAIAAPETDLMTFLSSKQTVGGDILKRVNDFASDPERGSRFVGSEDFSSQWGAIRSIAIPVREAGEIKTAVMYYVSHGIKADDWREKDRATVLETFMNETEDSSLRVSLINLASVMAKKCKNNQ